MKTMIKFCSIILFLVICTSVCAQEYSLDLPEGKDMTVKIDNVVAVLQIEGRSGNKMTVEAAGLKPPPEKAEGLRALKRTGLDNTGLALNILEYDDMIVISGGSSEQELSYQIDLPSDVNLVVTNSWCYDRKDFSNNKDLTVRNISGEIEIYSMGGKVDLVDVTGPVVAKADNGELNIVFSELRQESPISLISSNGDIDVTVPASSKATFKLAAGVGEIYTDLDLEKLEEEPKELSTFDKSDLKIYSYEKDKLITVPEVYVRPRISSSDILFRMISDKKLNGTTVLKASDLYSTALLYGGLLGSYDYKGTLNGGGVEISIRAQNGNLYLRKSK